MDEDKSYEKLKTVPDHIRYEFTNNILGWTQKIVLNFNLYLCHKTSPYL